MVKERGFTGIQYFNNKPSKEKINGKWKMQFPCGKCDQRFHSKEDTKEHMTSNHMKHYYFFKDDIIHYNPRPQDSHMQEEHSNDSSTNKNDTEEEILGKVINLKEHLTVPLGKKGNCYKYGHFSKCKYFLIYS